MLRFESNCGHDVLASLFRIKSHYSGNVHAARMRPLLFVGAGVFRGVVGAGLGSALEAYGLIDCFADVVGISTGAACAQFGLSGQIRQHRDIYWTDARRKEFISLSRLLTDKPVQDTRFLSDVFRRKLNLDALFASLPQFHIGVTHAKTGKGHFLNAKEVPDMHEAIRASMSIPVFSGEPVVIEGEPYIDGAVAFGFPIRELIERYDPTHLLVFANGPDIERYLPGQRFFESMFLSKYPSGVREQIESRFERFADDVAYLRRLTIPWMAYWGPDFSTRERNPDTLQTECLKAETQMITLLMHAQAAAILDPAH